MALLAANTNGRHHAICAIISPAAAQARPRVGAGVIYFLALLARAQQQLAETRKTSWYYRLIAILAVTVALICLTDFLALSVRGAIEKADRDWLWGAQQVTAKDVSSAVLDGFRPKSIQLLIAITGDELTARYTVTSSSGNTLMRQGQLGEDAETGNFVVENLLGQVRIGQFRDGITGDALSWNQLAFGSPQLQFAGGTTTVTIKSDPFRLLLDKQYIRLLPPPGSSEGFPETLQITDTSAVQVPGAFGALMTSAGNRNTDLSRRSDSVSTIVVREPGQNWTTGLRAMGGITIPFAGGLLRHVADIFVYLVLLWGLARAGRDYTAAGRELPAVVAVGKRAVTTIVGAFAALAILSFGYELLYELVPTSRLKGPVLAGPVGLAVAGAVVLWPALCWRVVPARDGDAGAGTGLGHGWWRLCVMAAAALVYLRLLYYWPGLDLLAHWQVIPLAAGIVLLVYVLVGIVFSGRDTGLLPFAVSVGMLAAILGATLAWPILVYSGFRFGSQSQVLYVNVIGKWAYLAVAAITLAGLCLMAVRVITALCRSHTGQPGREKPAAEPGRLVPWGASAAVAAVILVATIPSLIAQSEVSDPRAKGLLPADLIFYTGLYRALPQLLNWLFLGLAIAVLLALAPAPGAQEGTVAYRSAVRRIAIPVMALILFSVYAHYPWLFSDYTWLYIPVTPIVGVMLVAWLVLPANLAEKHRTLAPADAIHRTMDAWRFAEFADSQRQKLLADDDDLRNAIKENGLAGYRKAFRSFAIAQNLLARRHDRWQRRAQSLIRQAFDHQGDLPDATTARCGAAAGAVLGTAPAAILVISTRPAPGWSGYPALDFFGYTAWILFIWPALGWAIGYFLPFIRGQNGVVKGLWIYAAAAASLPMNLMWLDGRGWAAALIYYLELFAFLLVISVILCDLMALRSAHMRPSAWIQVHNWRFLVTWSTAVLAAIGTATVTFLSTTATDLGHQTITVFTGQSAPSNGIAGSSAGAATRPGGNG